MRELNARIGEPSNETPITEGTSTMAVFPVPERIKLVIALSQLDPLGSIRHCASMRNSPRVHRGTDASIIRGGKSTRVFHRVFPGIESKCTDTKCRREKLLLR